MKTLKTGFGFLCVLLFLGCSTATIYTTPDFALYKVEHKRVALLPFEVRIDPNNRGKDMTIEQFNELEREQGETFQQALYSDFLQGQQRGRYTVWFQDTSQTKARLSKHCDDWNECLEKLPTLPKDELCEILEVDAVISGQMSLSKPLGHSAAIAMLVLTGIGGKTNEAHINISIHEASEGKLLWSYEHVAGGDLLSSPEKLAKSFMEDVSSTFPYSDSVRQTI